MSCNQGDSIRAGSIPSYQSLIERQSFNDVKPYELSYEDANSLYQEVIHNLKNRGYAGIIRPFRFKESESKKHVLSILIQRSSEYDYVHPDTQIARIGSMVQNILILNSGNIRYINFLTKRVRSNISKLSKAYLKPYYSGYYVQDIACRTFDDLDIISILRGHIDFINSNLESCKVIDFYLDGEQIKPSDSNIMVGTLNRDMFKDLIERYQEWWGRDSDKITIKEQDIRASIHLMLQDKSYSKSVIDIKIAQKNDKWVIGCSLPLGVSPYLILKQLYPKIKLNEIYHNSSFVVLDSYKSLDKVGSKTVPKGSESCSCGKGLVYSMIKRQVSRVCPDCQIRYMMGKFVSMR